MTNKERTDRWINDDDANIPSHFFTDAELARREQAQHTPGPYTDTHNVADLNDEELYRLRDYGKFDTDRTAAAIELDRRWHVAHPQGEDDALAAARRVAVNVATERDRLAAENERLRGLLAALTQAATTYRDRTSSDTYDDLTAAIEAAKEAVK